MKAKVNFIGGGSIDNGYSEIRNIVIKVDGAKFTINYSKIYGLIVNKVSIDDNNTDSISVQPRTSNEIQLK